MRVTRIKYKDSPWIACYNVIEADLVETHQLEEYELEDGTIINIEQPSFTCVECGGLSDKLRFLPTGEGPLCQGCFILSSEEAVPGQDLACASQP